MRTNYFFLFFLFFPLCLAAQTLPYKDKSLPTEQRVEDLLKRMTLQEKVDQLCMKSLRELATDKKGKVTPESLDKLFAGSSIGCLESPFIEHAAIAQYSEAADKYLRTKTRLGIPAIQIAECLHGQLAMGTTIFPQAVAQGSTWNPDLIKEMASTIALEASLSGVDQALSPLFDLARDPRFGRVEECYGEDPYLVKKMGIAFVTGMQGEANVTKIGLPENKLACTAKHFVAYSVPEAGINIAPSFVGERTLRELHLYPFEGVVREANVYSVMPTYHEVEGIPTHVHKWLLTDILRGEWGFDGYVFSDYGSVDMLEWFHKVATDMPDAALQSLTAGVDLEAPSNVAFRHLESLVTSGRLPEEVLDRAVRRVLTTKYKMGLFDRPYTVPKNRADLVHTKEAKALARKIAEESAVLLKNDRSILPLDANAIKSLAVIGPNADRVQFGDYSITNSNKFGTTVLQGIRNYVGDQVKVNYAEGCSVTDLNTSGFEAAVQAASESDMIVLVLGGASSPLSGIGWGIQDDNNSYTCGEGYDRNELNFPGVQPQLLEKIAGLGKPIILVMVNGRAYTIAEEVKKANAILEAWYPGECGGDAVADILFGKVNPSGRLPVTFPPTVGHIPMYANAKPSSRGYYRQGGSPEKPGRDYVFSKPEPLFSFGFGLSYTTFEYSNIQIENRLDKESNCVTVSFTIKNTGNRDGAEVAQLYVRDCVSSVTTPVKSLRAFKKVFLKSGEGCKVTLDVAKEDLMLWNRDMQFVLEPGDFEVMIGASCDDIRLKDKFTVICHTLGTNN